jgi:DNA-binding MarR family transcriptional regulator
VLADDPNQISSLYNSCHMNRSVQLTAVEQESVVDAVLSASRVLVAIAARSLADAGEEVTLTQYRSLVVLASRGPQSMAALAEAVTVTPATASRMCERLVKKGLVRRRSDRHDRRQVRLALTETGRHLVDTVSARRRLEIAALLEGIPPETQESLVSALTHLAHSAGEVPEQSWSTGWDL